MDSPVNIAALARAMEASLPEVPFAHLFGSMASGEFREGSDIDLAFWYDGPDPLFKLRVLGVVEPLAGPIPIDLVNLKNADPLLAHNVISGKVLFVRPEKTEFYADVFTRICAEYEDSIYRMKKQLMYRGYEVQWDD